MNKLSQKQINEFCANIRNLVSLLNDADFPVISGTQVWTNGFNRKTEIIIDCERIEDLQTKTDEVYDFLFKNGFSHYSLQCAVKGVFYPKYKSSQVVIENINDSDLHKAQFYKNDIITTIHKITEPPPKIKTK